MKVGLMLALGEDDSLLRTLPWDRSRAGPSRTLLQAKEERRVPLVRPLRRWDGPPRRAECGASQDLRSLPAESPRRSG